MNLKKLFLTNNACYKAGKKIIPKGIMIHSTGANNPNLNRYVGPDDGLLGKNRYNNHWNQDRPDGRQVCPHAFIGKLKDGNIDSYQTLPWNHRGWHAGGTANNTHIGIEICEDNLKDSLYFSKVYNEALELCVFLCKEYNIPTDNIIGHYEGYKKGIASNHGDPNNWFPIHGKNMGTFRADVKKLLEYKKADEEPSNVNIKIGDLVKIRGSNYYNGKAIPNWVKGLSWYVHSIKGDRVILDTDENYKHSIMSPFLMSDLAKVRSCQGFKMPKK